VAARWARREERVSGVVSRSRDAAAVDAAEAELAASTTSRMAQSDAPHAPAPWLRSRDNADDGAAGSCTRAADVALRQLSRLFSCSHDDDTGAADADGAPRDGVVGAAAALLGPVAGRRLGRDDLLGALLGRRGHGAVASTPCRRRRSRRR
jgi:hypothetical protein